MSAAAGTHVVYTIVWEEQAFDSVVQYSADGKVYEVPYTYKLSVPKIDTSYNVQCINNNGGSVSSTPTAPSNVDSSPAQALCPETVSQSKVNSWTVGFANADVSIVDASINDFNLRDPSKGNFQAGDTIPSGVLVATNFDERDANKWKQYPVTPIVHSGSWGLFQTNEQYIAPNAGACMSIVP
jgi:hypothetical protein